MGYSVDTLYDRFPDLKILKEDVESAFITLKRVFSDGGTLFVCGNGGSAADAEHVVGELMKGFLLPRRVYSSMSETLSGMYGDAGCEIAANLQEGLPAVSLTAHPALSTAFANDMAPELIFAQQLYALAKRGDALLAFSTSGNSENIIKTLMIAKAIGVSTIAMTGRGGGECAKLADITIRVPEDETYKVQESHLPIYHALCAMLEEEFYGGEC